MNTSYYFSNKISVADTNLVRVSVSFPKNIVWLQNSKVYKPLCPKWDIVDQYKKGRIGDSQYILLYYKQNLDCLDPEKVYQALGEDSILLCWEKPGMFCHRSIVATWFEKSLGVKVPEL